MQQILTGDTSRDYSEQVKGEAMNSQVLSKVE